MLGSWPSGDNDWPDVDGADHRLTLGNLFLFPLTHVFLTELRSQEVVIPSPGTSKKSKLILSLISCYSRHNGSLSPPCDNTAWHIQYGSITVTEASCSLLAQNQPLFKRVWFLVHRTRQGNACLPMGTHPRTWKAEAGGRLKVTSHLV